MRDMERRPDLSRLKSRRRTTVSVSRESLVDIGTLEDGAPLPAVIEARMPDLDPVEWAAANRELVEARLAEHAGVLLRGFAPSEESDLERFIQVFDPDLLEYTYRSTPRTRLSGRIYTSTEYPPEHSISFHNEMSYAASWPARIWFLCIQPAARKGETPIADSRRVFEGIDPEIRRRFTEHGVMYVRNYGRSLDLPWQEVFQTEDRAEVDGFCREAGIETIWRDGDRLTTRQICQAVFDHPRTGETVWFNQAHLFHVSSLEPDVRQSLLSTFGEEGLPRNSYYGDGSRIDDETLDHVRRAYRDEEVVFPWRRGDLLMLDNVLVAHARRPFGGPRKIVVGMAGTMS